MSGDKARVIAEREKAVEDFYQEFCNSPGEIACTDFGRKCWDAAIEAAAKATCKLCREHGLSDDNGKHIWGEGPTRRVANCDAPAIRALKGGA